MPDTTRPAAWPKRLLDAALGIGLVAAVAAVFAFDRGPSLVPPVVEVGSPALAKADAPPMPFIPLSLPDGGGDKTPPPLPPPPAVPEDEAAPPKEEAVIETNEVKPGQVLRVGFSGIRQFGFFTQKADRTPERRLTLNEFGHTNHTLVTAGTGEFDTREAEFFDSNAGVIIKDLESEGKSTATSSIKGREAGKEIEVNQLASDGPYVVQWNYQGILVEQKVEYVPGEVSRAMDTAKVTYTLSNMNRTPHRVGMRVLIDTLIGGNDGVPFYVPGKEGVIDKPTLFDGKEVPDTVFALEKDDLTDPKLTIVQIGFGGEGNEKPNRLVLSQWPGDRALAKKFPNEQWRALVNLKRTWPLGKTFGGDSALGLFYEPKEIPARESRTFSFTYGLGSLSSGKSRNATLALAPTGPFVAGQTFRVTALVKDPADKQTVRLTLPDGLQLAENEAAEKQVDAKPGVKIAKADWVVSIAPTLGGKQTLQAEIVGTATRESGDVFVENPNPVLHSVAVTGRPTPGGLVRVTAAVLKPKAGMTATLTLPKGTTLEGTGAEKQTVPAGKVAQPTWLVRLADTAAGDLTFTVRTTDPNTEQSAKVTVAPPQTALGDVRVDGLPQSGGVLRVTAQVIYPKGGQKLTLTLPTGLQLAKDEKAEKPLPGGRVAQLSWLVSIDPGRTGDAAISVRLFPGTESASRTVTIQAAKPVLEVRRADEAAVPPGKPFWVVARVFHSPGSTTATVRLPKGLKLLDGHETTKPLEAKERDGFRYTEAAWPVVVGEYTEPTVTVSVTAGEVGEQAVKVACERGTLIGK